MLNLFSYKTIISFLRVVDRPKKRAISYLKTSFPSLINSISEKPVKPVKGMKTENENTWSDVINFCKRQVGELNHGVIVGLSNCQTRDKS